MAVENCLKGNMNTRLSKVLKVFAWQGGTIHQANEEAEGCLERSIDIIGMSDFEFSEFLDELTRCYPRYIAYHREQERYL